MKKLVLLPILALALVFTTCDLLNNNTIVTYTVTFNSNGGSPVPDQTVISGNTTIRPTDPVRTGYRLDGWYSNSALTIPYTFTDPVTGNITLYAKWIEIPAGSHLVIFESNGGSHVQSQTVDSGETAEWPIEPERTGYFLEGWYSDSGLNTVYDFESPVTANITLYAKWELVIPSSVSLNKNAITLAIGGSKQLIATVYPENTLNQDVTWTTDKPAVARVTNGIVVAEAEGTAVIIATSVAGNKVAMCVVTVVRNIVLPDSMYSVLAKGYDITGRYADPTYVKASVLDINKLRNDGRFIRTPNTTMGQFDTIYGNDAHSYQDKLATRVKVSAGGSANVIFAKAAFSMEVGMSFGRDKAESGEYAFATQMGTILKDAYFIQDRDGLQEYFTEGFTNDLVNLSNEELIAKYGTHVMLGGTLGARYEYNMSVEKYANSTETKLEAYLKAHAEASGFGSKGSVDTEASVKAQYNSDFNTATTTVSTRVYGGLPELGQGIQSNGDYTAWINSIDGREIWADYYPGSLILLSDLVPESRRASLFAAILEYCSGKTIVIHDPAMPSWYSHTVTFIKNNDDDGSTEANPQTKTVTTPATTVDALPAKTTEHPEWAEPTRPGWVFTGWNTKQDGSGTTFTETTTVTRDTIVYAQWRFDIEMVWINPGTFTMGSPSTESGRNSNETQHQVTLTSGFYMGKYEVTQKQYEMVMESLPTSLSSSTYGKGNNYPVYYVSWYDALVFCNKLSIMEGLTPAYRINGSTNPVAWGTLPTSNNATWNAVQIVAGSNGYRLPTEAQFEYACRAGTTTAYNTGSDITFDTGWYSANSGNKNHEVGLLPPNAWGLYDMHGNVHEWVWDWNGSYSSGAQTDPLGASSGPTKIVRGGGWNASAQNLRSAFRGIATNQTPYFRYQSLGFRVIRPE